MNACLLATVLAGCSLCAFGQDNAARIAELEKKLASASETIRTLATTVEGLRVEIAVLKAEHHNPASSAKTDDQRVEQVLDPGIGSDERDSALRAKPEIFIQARYATLPIRGSNAPFEPNFSLTRIESRWAGRISDKIGAGLELQFHPAIDGSPEELVNDAFLEYYVSRHLTVRIGQYIKPFGFDIQQSSATRESPERAMFAGYFFPGQRDRGITIRGDLGFFEHKALHDVTYYVGAFNGNRFFADRDRQLNYIVRVRKLIMPHLAAGASVQRGKQILPPGMRGNNDENLTGLDLQYAVGRFGLRGEFVVGNMPSTLLAIEPAFASAFQPGNRSRGGHLFGSYRVARRDVAYARYDQFNHDPVTGLNIRAFNVGYFRQIGDLSRVGIDYQFKNRPSFNDDAVNGRLNISFAVEVP